MKGATSTPILSQKLPRILLTYCATPHATTSNPPCELFFGQKIRTLFDLLHSNQQKAVHNKQAS